MSLFLFSLMFFRKAKTSTSILETDGLKIEVSFKPIRHLYIKVSGRTGEVRVSAPHGISEAGLIRFIRSKRDWVDRQREKAAQVTPPKKLQYADGELHRVERKEFPLRVVEASAKPKVWIEDNTLMLRVRPGSGREQREKALREWYRSRLKEVIPGLIRHWEPVMGVQVAGFGVKKMKTRWGTCNIRDRRIWLSLELAKYSPEALEYVVVHEMVHLLERLHSRRFYALMGHFLPDWKEREKELKGRSID